MQKHTLALISLAGCCLDFLGGMYLAYDLLGGKHGPLRTLTRMVTYGVLFGLGYGLPLGAPFGLAAGAAHGLTLGLEFSRASRGVTGPSPWLDLAMSAIRGLGFGIGASFRFGPQFAAAFGLLSFVGQAIAYRFDIRPSMDYGPQARPRITRRQMMSSLNRTLGYGVAGYLSGIFSGRRHEGMLFGLQAGLTIGAVTTLIISLVPFIEWKADSIEDRRLGVLGVALIMVGFAMQSLQYWVALLDVPVQ